MKLDKLLSFTPNPNISESDLLKAASRLRDILSRERIEFNTYVNDKDLVTAYIVFYFSSNISKLSFLDRVEYDLKQRWRNASVLDFGCGPATYLFALDEWIKDFEGELVGVDHSELMIESAKKILPQAHFKSELPQRPIDLAIFGNSLNENDLRPLELVLSKNQPKDILFIEPGSKESFAQMLKVRSHLLKNGYEVIFPCSSNQSCPLDRGEDWCHQYSFHSPDQSVERLMQKLHWDRRKLPMTLHLYSRELKTYSKRLVQRAKPVQKFGQALSICSNSSDLNQIDARTLKKSELKVQGLKRFHEGDILKI